MQTWKKQLNSNEDVWTILEMERLNFENMRITDNICYLLDTRRNDKQLFTSDVFKEYENRQYLAKAEYELRKAALEKKTVPDYLGVTHWNLNYATREFRITPDCDIDKEVEKKLSDDGWEKEECNDCQCVVKPLASAMGSVKKKTKLQKIK